MKAAHGGQVLVSQAVVDRANAQLPSTITLRDLGAVRLRDLASSERVYQLIHPDLRQDFPPLRSLEATPNNLPPQVTSFVGRERELAEAKALLGKHTHPHAARHGRPGQDPAVSADRRRRAGEVSGRRLVRRSRAIKDGSLVPNVTAQVLGVREESGKPMLQTLCTYVKEHKLLLIIDNCEHLMSACAELANALLRSAPDVRMLATSREALHINGEQTYPVHPLRVPSRSAGAESLLRSDAVQLFIERTRLQKPDFTVSESEAPAVADLCARLDGNSAGAGTGRSPHAVHVGGADQRAAQ